MYSVSAKRAGLTAAAVSAALLIAACSSSSSSSSSAPASTSPSEPSASASSTSGSSSVPQISYTGLTNDFSAMKSLKSIAAAGKGNITVILPDTVSSTRYVEFDAPYLKDAFAAAGLSSSNYTVENALGVDATQLSMAQSAITKGATVLVVDPLDSGVGAHIESIAKAAGVKVIDYDRLTLGGSRSYYVSFNNVLVGTLLGDGLVSCVSAWGVKDPQVTVMHGATTDNNATLFAQGYDAVLKPLFASGKWTDVSNPPGTWTPDVALSEFQQTYTAHKNINAALIPNDENGAPIIHYLQGQGIKAKTFPTTGQDATLTGLDNILSGYQCGTVYKPIYEEAQAAAALAIFLRDNVTPPTSLVNGSTPDTTSKVRFPRFCSSRSG